MIPAILLLGACGWARDEVDGLAWWTRTIVTDRVGEAVVSLPLDEGENRFAVTGVAESGQLVHLRRLQDPDGTVVFDAIGVLSTPFAVSGAAWLKDVSTLNWPALPTEPDPSSGRWQVVVGTTDSLGRSVTGEVALTAVIGRDPDVDAGLLPVTLVLTPEVEADDAFVAGLDAALDLWTDLLAPHGVTLEITRERWDGDALAAPGLGTPEAWIDLADATPPRSIRVVVTDTLPDLPGVLGLAGDAPVSLASTARSGVIVSREMAWGPDGTLDDTEIRLLAETIAHETGHALGLFHPVELTWNLWDSLDDTPACTAEDPCESALGDNLMFPYPRCGAGGCVPQDTLTEGQVGVIQRAVVLR